LSAELDSEKVEALRRYERLLATRAIEAGFISAHDRHRLWDRHVLDSLRALDCIGPGDRTVADLGSGAGLPGIPLAIARPDISVFLVERHLRRAGFLESAVLELALHNATVLAGAIEEASLETDACTARALAPPAAAWGLADRRLAPGGGLIYFAGKTSSSSLIKLERSTPSSLPGDAEHEICSPGKFPWQGPLVIMRRAAEHSAP